MKFPKCAIPTILLAVLVLGCDTQQTAADLIAIVGTSVATLEGIEGNSTLVAKIQKDTQLATQQVLNFKDGSSTQDVIAALNLVEEDLNLLPISGQNQVFIDLAISTTEEIIMLFPQTTSTPMLAVHHAVIQRPIATAPAKNAKDFKKRWNALIAARPNLAAAKIQ